MATPTRQTSEAELARWNAEWRANPIYAQALQSMGVDPSRPIKLSDRQQEQLERTLAASGMRVPDGMHIDQAGNLNQKNRLVRNIGIGAAIGGAALTGVGLAGIGPLAGLGGAAGGAAGAAGGGGLLTSTAIPTSLAMGSVPGITAGGAGLGAAAGGGILGALGKGAGVLSDLGSVLGGAVKGKEGARGQDQGAILGQQQLLQQGARDQFSAGLQGANFQREGQDRERKQQILMQLLNNTQDQSITPGNPNIASRMPQVTGGARPSNLTGNREALMALLGQPQVSAPMYQPPPSMKLPMASGLEKALDFGALGTSILGALGRRR